MYFQQTTRQKFKTDERVSCVKLDYHGNKQGPKDRKRNSTVMISIFNETANPPLPQE